MSRSVRIFLTTMFGLVVASGLYTGCSGDECKSNADCKTAGQVCKSSGGVNKCVAGSSENTTPDGGSESTTPDGEAVTTPDGEAVTTPDGEAVTTPDGEVVTEQPPTETPTEQPAGTGAVGDICTQQQGNPTGTCQAGLVCLGISQTEARCFQDCTSNQALCAANTDGRTVCEAVTADGSVSVCLNTAATEGQDCGFSNKSQARCKEDSATPNPDLYCSATTQKCTKYEIKSNVGDPCNKTGDNSEPVKFCDVSGAKPLACDPNTGTCIEQTLVGTLEKCGGTKGCATDDVCVGFDDGNGGTVSFCLKKCTPGGASTCPGSAECLTLNSGAGACRWAGTLDQDALCTPLDTTKDKIDTTNLCKGGLQCVGLNGTKVICI